MTKRKEFSILKWLIFPANSLILAGCIAWFNLSVFGFDDGLPYTLIVALICVFSIVINKYTESDNRTLARAAFIFEIVLTVALVVNAAYSISVQRKMSVAKMAETSQADTIDKISKLRGSRTQREALKKVEQNQSAQSVFSEVEQILFWIMVGELALYGLSAFTLFALAKLMDDSRQVEHRRSPDKYGDEFLDEELDVNVIEKRSLTRRGDLTAKTTTHDDRIDDTRSGRKTTQAKYPPGLRELRESSKADRIRESARTLQG